MAAGGGEGGGGVFNFDCKHIPDRYFLVKGLLLGTGICYSRIYFFDTGSVAGCYFLGVRIS